MNERPLPFAPQAVLLDMDGLMLDSERALLECWQQASAEQQVGIDDAFWLSMVGLHERECTRLLRERLGREPADALRARCHVLHSARVDAGLDHRPGLQPLLELLVEQGMTRAVVTSTRRERALQKLGAAGLLRHFDTVLTGSDIEHPKPAPDIYLLAASRLGVEPAGCLVLEDSVPGVRAALAAGMTPVQVPDLVAPDAQARALGHRVVASLHEARELLQQALALRA